MAAVRINFGKNSSISACLTFRIATEIMCKGDAAHVLSNVELILPWNVVEACYNLERNDSTNFFAKNEVEATTSQISLCKLDDNSVRIQVTGE